MSLYSPRFTTRTTQTSLYSTASPSSMYASSGKNMTPMEISSFSLESPPTRETKQWQHLYVLPVLLLEFLALSLTKAVMPKLLLEKYDTRVYLVMGLAECVRGLLAFVSCPLFGKLSDIVGRKLCLLVTVAGTCAPVCSLALLSWEIPSFEAADTTDIVMNVTDTVFNVTVADEEEASVAWPALLEKQASSLHPNAISAFVILLALSGIFSSTFTLVFAYISDTIQRRDERVSAYGLALATFGLSFTIGPMAGGYLAQYNTRYVFVCSFLLTIIDLIYIYTILPESVQHDRADAAASIVQVSWSPLETLRIVAVDPFLRLVGQVAFLYYTALWAVISTLVLYAAKRFQLGPERLGELMSALGLSTMVAEAVLVRIVVPILGEKKSMRLGLAAFGFQCVILGLAYEGWHLFVCILFAMVGNLVFPSLSSLVSSSVEPGSVGEALGAVNGIKALTEGIGPLVFGTLMTLSENSALPGWPYLLAALIVFIAYEQSRKLPDTDDDDYIHELERKRPPKYLQLFLGRPRESSFSYDEECEDLLGDEDEYAAGMLSEIDESDEDGRNVAHSCDARTPITFASVMNKPPPNP